MLEHPPEQIAVLELSSFQLETIDQFHPHISAWLNLAPDHMDRYATFEEYRQAKLALFRNQTASDFAVINAANGPNIDLYAQTISFSAFQEGADYHLCDGEILHRGEAILRLDETRLAGRHNAENLMAALAVGSLQGLSQEGMRRAARTYHPPRHRCERVVEGAPWIILNDSKSTNVHALESSLRALDGPIVLIAGGKQKGLDYSGLKPWLGQKVNHLVTLGEIRHSLAELAESHCPCTKASSLEEAVKAALANAAPGQIILFSPGTSSFDMFEGHEHRGDTFRTLVKQQLTNHEKETSNEHLAGVSPARERHA